MANDVLLLASSSSQSMQPLESNAGSSSTNNDSEVDEDLHSSSWYDLNKSLEVDYGAYKSLKKPPTAIDIDRVIQFVTNTKDEDEKFLGGLWLTKFYDYKDKYGERDPSQRIRSSQIAKENLLKPKSTSVIHLTGSRTTSPATVPLPIDADDIPKSNAKTKNGTFQLQLPIIIEHIQFIFKIS